MAIDKNAAREEKLRALRERLTSGVEQLVTGEDWKRAMEFAAKFRSRSFGNSILIYVQHLEAYEKSRVPHPTPTHVAGYRQWQGLDRNVMKGQAGYQILAPVTARFASRTPADPGSWRRLGRGEKPEGGEVVRSRMVGVTPAYVWDVSMTDGAPIPQVPTPQLLKGQAPPGMREGLIAEIETNGFVVVGVPNAGVMGGANGQTDYATNVVSVRTDIDDSAQVKVLAHELGHVLMHRPDNPDWQRHAGIGEVEAESFALMISAAHGMDTSVYTLPYVAGWAASVPGKTTAEVVQSTADRVCKVASEALDRFETVQVGDGRPDGLGSGRGNIALEPQTLDAVNSTERAQSTPNDRPTADPAALEDALHVAEAATATAEAGTRLGRSQRRASPSGARRAVVAGQALGR